MNKALERIAQLEKHNADLEHARLTSEVASAKTVDAQLLQGSTREEVEAYADTLMVGIPVALSSLIAGFFVDHGLAQLAFVIALICLLAAIVVVLYPAVRTIPRPDHWIIPEE